MNRGFAVDPVTDETATRPQNLSPGAARREFQKSDCPRRKSYRRFSDRGSIPLRSTKKERPRLVRGRSFLMDPRLISNPSILRLSAQNLTFSPSDTASLLLCGARTRGSEALAPSVDSPQIPRASALVRLSRKAFNHRLLSPSSRSPSNPARKRACSPLSQSVQPSVTFSFVPVPVESRLRVARKLTPSNGFFGRHRFTGKLGTKPPRGTPFLFPDPSFFDMYTLHIYSAFLLCVLLFFNFKSINFLIFLQNQSTIDFSGFGNGRNEERSRMRCSSVRSRKSLPYRREKTV